MKRSSLLVLGLALLLNACVTTSTTSINASLSTYEYDQNFNLMSVYPVNAYRMELTDQNQNIEQYSLKLEYVDFEDIQHQLVIEDAYFDVFKQVLRQKSRIQPNQTDTVSVINNGQYTSINLIVNFV